MIFSSTEQQLNGQTLALAGLLQSAYLVDQIARLGSAPPESFNPSINSLFAFDVATPAEIFGSVHGVDLGLRLIQDVLGGGGKAEHAQVIRYALGMIHLEKQLAKKPEMLAIIRNRLEHASLKAEHFTPAPQSIASSIAAIYQDTISTFKFRIQVTGSLPQLQNTQNADKIRALLLAGIRAAVLWRQMGGKRWQLLFNRGPLVKKSRALLGR